MGNSGGCLKSASRNIVYDYAMAGPRKPKLMPGWERVASGIELMIWSRLASWNGLRLKASTDQDIFNQHWPTIDPRFGRWLCWVAFGVGAEGILKGVFGIKGYPVERFGASHPWKTHMGMSDENVDRVSKAVSLLVEIRNRDAHGYVPGVRDSNFPEVASQFVPALNQVLDCLSDNDIRLHIPVQYSNFESPQT